MKRKKYQMPGRDEPLTVEDSVIEAKEFKSLQLYSTWQRGVVCYSGYIMSGFGTGDDNTKGKIRVLTFSVN